MKRVLSIILAMMCLLSSLPVLAEEKGSIFESAGEFFGSAWNSAGELWNDATTAAGDALNAAGDAIGQGWASLSGAALEAWNKAGTYLGEKNAEFNVWMSINGNDALERLKEAFDETTVELGLPQSESDKLWLQIMNYANDNGIANITLAKLTLAAFVYAQAETDGIEVLEFTLDMVTNSGITNQEAAEAALAVMAAGSTGEEIDTENVGNRYYMGQVVNTGTDNGFSGSNKIDRKDPHFGWELGRFFVSGYTRVMQDENGNPIFLKNAGDTVTLWFNLGQDIECLDGNDDLAVVSDANGYDEYFGIPRTDFGRGALIIRYTDYQNAAGEPVIYRDYLAGNLSIGADTTVQLFEEGDYEVALDYETKGKTLGIIDDYNNYRIAFKFSVRNGNCMIFPMDVVTKEELLNTAITPNGFYIDLARSRYLDINIKRETLTEGAMGLIEDVRFNHPAKEGDQYTEEGIYTITVINRYTGQNTTKRIYVGSNAILRAHVVTELSIEEIQQMLSEGAQILEDGTITKPTDD